MTLLGVVSILDAVTKNLTLLINTHDVLHLCGSHLALPGSVVWGEFFT